MTKYNVLWKLPVLLFCIFALHGEARSITLYLEGIVTVPYGDIPVGTKIEGLTTFESNTQAELYGDGGTPYDCPPLCEYINPVTAGRISVGGKTWILGPAFPGDSQSSLWLSDNAYTPEDIFSGGFYLQGPKIGAESPFYFGFGVTDNTGTRFNGAGLPLKLDFEGLYGNWRLDVNSDPYEYLYGQLTYLSTSKPSKTALIGKSTDSVGLLSLKVNGETYDSMAMLASGHAWIEFEDFRAGTINTWGTYPDPNNVLTRGFLYNNNELSYIASSSRSIYLTEDQYNKFRALLDQYESKSKKAMAWSAIKNCTDFAKNAWKAGSNEDVRFSSDEALDTIFAKLLPTPTGLNTKIIELNGIQLYKTINNCTGVYCP